MPAPSSLTAFLYNAFMSTLLFKLNGVPEDEVHDVRELLTSHDIDFYETHAGRWGISVAAIWLKDDRHLERAQALITRYQQERQLQARHAYEALRREGNHDTLAQRLRREPVRMLLYALAVAAILYLTIAPFFSGMAG